MKKLLSLGIIFILMLATKGLTMGELGKKKIENLFKDKYKYPVVEDITPQEDPYWFPRLRLYRVCDKKELAKVEKRRPQYIFSVYSKWLVTSSGKIFADHEIDLALKETGYFPKNDSEALYTAKKILEMKEGATVLEEEDITDKTGIIYIGDLEEIADGGLSEGRKQRIWNSLIKAGYIDKGGIIQQNFEGVIEKFKVNADLTNLEKEKLFDIFSLSLSSAVSPKIVKKLHPPKIKKKNDFYEIDLFGYRLSQSGFPQEWVIRYKIHAGKEYYKIKEKEEIWTAKGRYKW